MTAPATTTSPANPTSARLPEYAIYKPNSRNTGGVIRIGLNPAKAAVFVDGANQSGERQFDWDQKITMKWGFADIGGVLAVLQNRQPEVKLFHKTDTATSAFGFVSRQEPDRAPFLMSISRQENADKAVRKVTIPVTHAEAAILETALRSAVTCLLGW